jgi:hypothetical protein
VDATLRGLLALIAPGSVEAEVGRLQARIFSEHGLASAVALAPLIPISFLPVDATLRGLLAAVDRSAASPYRIETGPVAWEAGALFLSVETGGLWKGLRAGVGVSGIAAAEGPFPVFEGFFLGCGDATEAQRETIRPSQPPLGFTSSTLALIAVETPRGSREWWREVYCETLEQKPLRGSLKGSPMGKRAP